MPGYQTIEACYTLGDSHFVIRSLLDQQQYADPQGLAAAAGISSAQWPLFGLVWPSARILADAMQSVNIKGLRILEVGCGLALASLVLHGRAGNITASDCHPLAGSFLEENLRLNQLPAMEYQSGNWKLKCPELGEFDLIIASDVLYDRELPELLALFIDAHAASPVSVIILDPDRGNRNPFRRAMVNLGFVVTIEPAKRFQGSGEAYHGHYLHCHRP
ncbi:MAG: SAM-dependent methyltransferase [Pseudomonadales bacterium]|nr:SAM-dependent methyltransferase [Pseudomonadales bacterium]